MMDALADILKTIRLHTSTYFCSDFNTDWAMAIPQDNKGLFHILIEGQCWLEIAGKDSGLVLEAGDIVAFPTGGAHTLKHSPTSISHPAEEVVAGILSGANPFLITEEANEDSPEVWATLLCGAFEYDSSIDHPFMKDLPCLIHVRAKDTPELAWLRSLVQILAVESRQPSPGSTVMVDRLTEVLFIQLLRTHMNESQDEVNYLGALNDAKIGKALNLIHSETEGDLNIDSLAQAVALSRSAFGERFSRLVGESPKTYLQSWRLEKAKRALAEGEKSMYEIALDAGYTSEAAFSKGFKAHFEFTPGSIRKAGR